MQQLQSDGSYNELYPKTDAWTKDETLSAQVASVLGLRDNYKPDDAFLGLYFGAGTYRYRVRVLFDDGKPCSGCTVSGLTQIIGQSLVTDENGYVLGKSTSTSVTIAIAVPYLDWKTPDSQSIASTGIITDVVFTLEKVVDILTITSSQDGKISNYAKSVDVCFVGGGVDGETPIGYNSSCYGGSGASGGYKKRIQLSGDCFVQVVVGSRQETRKKASTSSVKINEAAISLDFSKQETANTDGAGSSGFRMFGDGDWLGSSGGYGGTCHDDGWGGSANGSPGGERAGAGGSAMVSAGGGTIWAKNGSSAINFGCGGGGGSFASNKSGTKRETGKGGVRCSGAAFFRFHF